METKNLAQNLDGDSPKSTKIDYAERGRTVRSWMSSSAQTNNIATWLPEIKDISRIMIPKTQLIELPDKWLGWLASDNYPENQIAEFQEFIESQLDPDFKDRTLFVRVGTFSNKFLFSDGPLVEDVNTLGRHILDIFYGCMLCGAGTTSTVAIREYIPPRLNTPTIYGGMPLRREIRFFVDFDNGEVLGYSDYWHPREMVRLIGNNMSNEAIEALANFDPDAIKHIEDFSKNLTTPFGENARDWLTYAKWYQDQTDIEPYIDSVLPRIKHLAKNCTLAGRWSVDIMFLAPHLPYLIDMATMDESALAQYMVEL